MNRILLKGYYGHGNLGDDILMMVSCRMLKEMFPKCQLQVASTADSCEYIVELTGGLVDEVVPVYPEARADLIVHGGGGTFYDFNRGPLVYRILNTAIDLMGKNNFSKGLDHYRRLKGWPSNRTTSKVALGIGIGAFAPDSKKYYYKMAELHNFDLILPRDQTSYQYLKNADISGEVIQATDLAFLQEYWAPDGLVAAGSEKNIGFVLKSWDYQRSHLDVIYQAALALDEAGYNISIFTFENAHDKNIRVRFKNFQQFTWNPCQMTLPEYLKSFVRSSLLVTSRAHGAILGGAFGIPAVCIGIEPKLSNVAKMFPNSSSYLPAHFTFEELFEKIMSGLKIPPEQVNLDFDNNRKVLLGSIKKMQVILAHNGNGSD